MTIQDNKEYVFTGAQLKQLKTYIDDAGGGITELTTADYDYPADNPRMVAVWKLPAGVYHAAKNVVFAVGISAYDNNPLVANTSTSGFRITVETSDDTRTVAITVTGFGDTVVQGSSYHVGSLAFAIHKDWGYGDYYQFRDGALIPRQKLDETYATNRIFSSNASGLVPAGGPSSSKRVLFNNGWGLWPQSDYSQSTNTSLDYIKNRPFYEDSTTVPTRINHDPSSSSEWPNEGAQYSIDPSLSSSLSALAVSVGAANPTGGEVYVGLQDSEYDDMVSAVANNANFSFSMTGKTFDMMSESENVIVLSFSGEAFALDATTGLYAATVTLYESWNNNNPHQNVLVVFGAKNDVDTRYEGTTNYLFAVLAPFSDEYFATGQWGYSGSVEWANISTVQAVTTLKQLDSKFVKVDGDTISVNSDDELEVQSINNLTSNETRAPLSANQGRLLNNKIVGTTETATIATADWTALTGADPYDYSATITATATISASTGVVELLNDQPALFGTYGFAIGAVSGQSVTVYSIGQPDASVSLKLNIRNL